MGGLPVVTRDAPPTCIGPDGGAPQAYKGLGLHEQYEPVKEEMSHDAALERETQRERFRVLIRQPSVNPPEVEQESLNIEPKQLYGEPKQEDTEDAIIVGAEWTSVSEEEEDEQELEGKPQLEIPDLAGLQGLSTKRLSWCMEDGEFSANPPETEASSQPEHLAGTSVSSAG
ncbi:hypothetical protein JD844_013767, partial [Phrynosoma platyrhinos]